MTAEKGLELRLRSELGEHSPSALGHPPAWQRHPTPSASTWVSPFLPPTGTGIPAAVQGCDQAAVVGGGGSHPPALPCSHPLIPCAALAHPSGTSRQQRVCFSGPLKKQKELDGWIGEERGSQCHQPCWCESRCDSSVPSPLPQPPPPAHPLGSPGGFWEAPAVAAGAQ